jgi:hypothetical protein
MGTDPQPITFPFPEQSRRFISKKNLVFLDVLQRGALPTLARSLKGQLRGHRGYLMSMWGFLFSFFVHRFLQALFAQKEAEPSGSPLGSCLMLSLGQNAG